MGEEIQVIARFTPSQYKRLEKAKRETGMTQKAILQRAFAQWDIQRKREPVIAE